MMTDTHDVISREDSEYWREQFLDSFDLHDELVENEDDIHEVEAAGDLPSDVTLQRIIASYEGVQVWLLNDYGPLQAFYTESEEWGDTGSSMEVADEVANRLTV